MIMKTKTSIGAVEQGRARQIPRHNLGIVSRKHIELVHSAMRGMIFPYRRCKIAHCPPGICTLQIDRQKVSHVGC